MTGKAELVKSVAETTGLTRSQVGSAVQGLLDELARRVAQGERVKLPGFGSFWAQNRAGRTGRNPRTGERVAIAPRRGVRFQVAVELRERLNPAEVPDGSSPSPEDTERRVEADTVVSGDDLDRPPPGPDQRIRR